MGRGGSKTNLDLGRGARDAPRDGAHAPAPLREAQLPLRDRRGTAQLGRAQLLGAQQDEVRDVESRRGAPGARGDQAVPGGQGQAGGSSGQRTGAADREQGATRLTAGENRAPEAFSVSDALYGRLRGFLDGDEAAALSHEALEAQLAVAGC